MFYESISIDFGNIFHKLKPILEYLFIIKIGYSKEGIHTDNKGSALHNIELSKARATSVMSFLKDKGITDERLSIKYFGETAPLNNNNTPYGRKANRRVEIKFVSL